MFKVELAREVLTMALETLRVNKLRSALTILGGVMVRGRSDYAFSGGSPAVLYSKDMIRLALQSALDYVVLSWKEM